VKISVLLKLHRVIQGAVVATAGVHAQLDTMLETGKYTLQYVQNLLANVSFRVTDVARFVRVDVSLHQCPQEKVRRVSIWGPCRPKIF